MTMATRAADPPPPEAMCGGVGLLDYDGDGWLDVYLVQGGPFPGGESHREPGRSTVSESAATAHLKM